MRPYPWTNERKRFTDQQRFGALLRRIFGWPLTGLAFVLNPASIVVPVWSLAGFRRTNDSWWKRGLLAVLAGGLIAAATFRPGTWLAAWQVALESFGNRATVPTREAILHAFALGLGPALILAGVSALCWAFYSEYHSMRFLYRTRPTWTMRIRKQINSRTIRSGKSPAKGYVPFGIIVDDPIPWRTNRYGRVVQRPMADFGHGCICGTNGSGKTIGGLNIAYHTSACSAAVFYLDFKASLKTQKALRAIAEERGVPFHSFDLGIGSTETTWYDPLGWGGKPSEMASLLLDSFTFQSSGAAEFYRGVAEQWLPLQLEVMEAVGRIGTESKFDFLLATSTPSGLAERMNGWRSGTDAQRALVAQWRERMEGTKADHLTALRNNLAKVVNSAGPRLRPDVEGDPPMSFAEAARTGGIVYFAMSVADSTVLKTLGSLAIRDITTLSAERQRVENLRDLRPVVVLVDEASRLAERASVMVDLFATAREALIWLWPITQSLSSYPDVVQREIRTNALTWVVYRLQDPGTAEQVTRSLGTIATESEVTEQEVTHHFLRASETQGSGDSRVTLGERQHLPADAVLKTPNRYCYVWFTGNWSRATKEKARSRRVRHDHVAFDAPLTLTVGLDLVTNPPEPKERAREFADMVTAPDDLYSDDSDSPQADPTRAEVSRTADNFAAPVVGTTDGTAPATAGQVNSKAGGRTPPPPAPAAVESHGPVVAGSSFTDTPLIDESRSTVPVWSPPAKPTTPEPSPQWPPAAASAPAVPPTPSPSASATSPVSAAPPSRVLKRRGRSTYDPIFNPAPPGHPEYVPPPQHLDNTTGAEAGPPPNTADHVASHSVEAYQGATSAVTADQAALIAERRRQVAASATGAAAPAPQPASVDSRDGSGRGDTTVDDDQQQPSSEEGKGTPSGHKPANAAPQQQGKPVDDLEQWA